jgi:two-component system nitrate/nitrite response regulator NarL
MITVFVVTGTRLYQDGLAHALNRRTEIRVVGSAGDCAEAIPRIREAAPDIAVVDIGKPPKLDSVRRLRRDAPRVGIVALAVPETEDEILRCAEAGIAGYVTRDGSLADLVQTLKSVARGETVCSPRVAARMLNRLAALASTRPPEPHLPHLTPRELEVVGLIDGGLSNKEIATQLQIELPTVKNHVHRILEKLQVRRRGEAAARMRAALVAED